MVFDCDTNSEDRRGSFTSSGHRRERSRNRSRNFSSSGSCFGSGGGSGGDGSGNRKSSGSRSTSNSMRFHTNSAANSDLTNRFSEGFSTNTGTRILPASGTSGSRGSKAESKSLHEQLNPHLTPPPQMQLVGGQGELQPLLDFLMEQGVARERIILVGTRKMPFQEENKLRVGKSKSESKSNSERKRKSKSKSKSTSKSCSKSKSLTDPNKRDRSKMRRHR